MKNFAVAIALTVLTAAAEGCCNPNHVCVDWEGPAWYLSHPTCECLHCPYATPRCPYYNYDQCQWMDVMPAPTLSAVFSPKAPPKLEQTTY